MRARLEKVDILGWNKSLIIKEGEALIEKSTQNMVIQRIKQTDWYVVPSIFKGGNSSNKES